MRIEIVKFNSVGDGVTAMYVDGKLHTWGDYYHDKIDTWCDGFIDGLTYSKKYFDVTNYYIEYEDNHELVSDICEMGASPPEYLKDVIDVD